MPQKIALMPVRRILRLAFAVCACLILTLSPTGCATQAMHVAADLTCAPGHLDRLYFGQNTPDGEVGATQWRDFVDAVIAPRFPDGFTEYEARGQWRSDRGTIDSEASRIIEIAHEGDPASRRRVGEIAHLYRTRFRQEAVLVVSAEADTCFAR